MNGGGAEAEEATTNAIFVVVMQKDRAKVARGTVHRDRTDVANQL